MENSNAGGGKDREQGAGAGQDLPFILQATPWTGSATGPAGSQVAGAQLPTTGPGEANHLTKQDGTAADDRKLPTVQGRKCWKRLDEMWNGGAAALSPTSDSNRRPSDYETDARGPAVSSPRRPPATGTLTQ
jgi:hypothetical protein